MIERPSDEELSGMTVNERLYACGLIDRWDTAAFGRDRAVMIIILLEAAFTEDQAVWTVDTLLANPARYGF